MLQSRQKLSCHPSRPHTRNEIGFAVEHHPMYVGGPVLLRIGVHVRLQPIGGEQLLQAIRGEPNRDHAVDELLNDVGTVLRQGSVREPSRRWPSAGVESINGLRGREELRRRKVSGMPLEHTALSARPPDLMRTLQVPARQTSDERPSRPVSLVDERDDVRDLSHESISRDDVGPRPAKCDLRNRWRGPDGGWPRNRRGRRAGRTRRQGIRRGCSGRSRASSPAVRPRRRPRGWAVCRPIRSRPR